MTTKYRRHSISEGISIRPHRGLLEEALKKEANKLLKGYAQQFLVKETFKMINEHNRKIKKQKKGLKVTWADKMIGTKMHVPLPRRYGPSVFWSHDA